MLRNISKLTNLNSAINYLYSTLTFIKKIFNLCMAIMNAKSTRYNLGVKYNLTLPNKNTIFEKRLYYQGIKMHDALPSNLQEEQSIKLYKRVIKHPYTN